MTRSRNAQPDSIRVGPRTFKINRVSGLQMPNAKAAWGETNFQEVTISVEAGLRGRAKLETLLHEAIHIVADQLEIKGLSEKAVGWLGYGLTEMLLDNPELIALFSEEATARQDRRERRKKR